MAEGTLGMNGYGDGSGYGYGYGCGSGDGSGSGYGYGYGYGCGYGDGYGSGNGEHKEVYLKAILEQHGLKGIVAFWRSGKDGKPSNGGSGKARALGQIEEIEGPLEICSAKALHGTLDPSKWKGDRWWIVRLHEPVQRQDDKIASLKREIIADLGKCPF